MKKMVSLALLMFALFAIGYGAVKVNAATSENRGRNTMSDAQINIFKEHKVLIAYFSWSGNTRKIAREIQQKIGGDIFEIVPVKNYGTDFHAAVEEARKELAANARPPLKNRVANIKDYDVVFIGFPNWVGTLPMPVHTFLEQYSFEGKTVIPFCTHGSGGLGDTVESLKKSLGNINILEPLSLGREEIDGDRDKITDWLNALKIPAAANAAQGNNANTPIEIVINGKKIKGILNDTPEAATFRAMLPQTVSMGAFGGREYYGDIKERINDTTQGKLNFADGDITYCPSNNTVAIFYAQTSRPNLTMRVITIGKVTDDLLIFHNLSDSVNMTFSIANKIEGEQTL